MIVEFSFSSSFDRRLGITASKKFGKAHQRNRFKRLVRESFRLSQNDLPEGIVLNVRPRTAAHKACLGDLLNELPVLLKTGNSSSNHDSKSRSLPTSE